MDPKKPPTDEEKREVTEKLTQLANRTVEYDREQAEKVLETWVTINREMREHKKAEEK